MSSQAPQEIKALIKSRLASLPGPQGNPDNEAYMVELVGKCDALAMFASDGSLMWAWSQDKMNSWYWHADVEEDANMYSSFSYVYTQGDGSKVEIPNETAVVANFMAGKSTTLFFNGSKFHVTQKDQTEDGISWAVMGGQDGRGLHCSISPAGDFMVVAAASIKAWPTEYYMGVQSDRKPGSITVDARTLGGAFRQFAPGALGV